MLSGRDLGAKPLDVLGWVQPLIKLAERQGPASGSPSMNLLWFPLFLVHVSFGPQRSPHCVGILDTTNAEFTLTLFSVFERFLQPQSRGLKRYLPLDYDCLHHVPHLSRRLQPSGTVTHTGPFAPQG